MDDVVVAEIRRVALHYDYPSLEHPQGQFVDVYLCYC